MNRTLKKKESLLEVLGTVWGDHIDVHVIDPPLPLRVHRRGTPGHALETGQHIGTLVFKHQSGYVILLKFPDGKIESYNPHFCFTTT